MFVRVPHVLKQSYLHTYANRKAYAGCKPMLTANIHYIISKLSHPTLICLVIKQVNHDVLLLTYQVH